MIPTLLDLRHALTAYGSVFGVAVSLWAVCVAFDQLLEYVAARRQRSYVISRLMDGDRRQR